MKIIAFYLPQFYSFEENNKWWGEGFTEWSNVKNAKPLFKNHYQPRIPLEDNYYCPLEEDVQIWQAKIAQEYGIYGFCYYHYWFEGKLLLEKPMEIMLENKKVNMPFCISWANHDWTKSWVGKNSEMLIKQTYGNKEDWIKHYEYLRKFFKDRRYILEENKPVFIIFKPGLIKKLKEMLECWDELAKEDGFDGICYIYQYGYDHQHEQNGDLFQYGIEYQPALARRKRKISFWYGCQYLRNSFMNLLGIHKEKPICFNYDEEWKRILQMKPKDEKMIPGAFVDWDNTPRYGKRGSVYVGVTPEKFEYYLTKQIQRAKEIYNKDMIFLFAWNEWGEGGYLEPDEKYQYSMLKAVKNALDKLDEKEI